MIKLSGAASRREIGAATGTPPRGSASTMTSEPANPASSSASRSPASVRSRYPLDLCPRLIANQIGQLLWTSIAVR